jgi:hypothetical protein
VTDFEAHKMLGEVADAAPAGDGINTYRYQSHIVKLEVVGISTAKMQEGARTQLDECFEITEPVFVGNENAYTAEYRHDDDITKLFDAINAVNYPPSPSTLPARK